MSHLLEQISREQTATNESLLLFFAHEGLRFFELHGLNPMSEEQVRQFSRYLEQQAGQTEMRIAHLRHRPGRSARLGMLRSFTAGTGPTADTAGQADDGREQYGFAATGIYPRASRHSRPSICLLKWVVRYGSSPFARGEKVQQGSLLAALDPTDFQLEAREAETQLKLARLDLDRKREILKKNGIAKSQVEDAEASFELQRVRLDKTRERLKRQQYVRTLRCLCIPSLHR